MLRGTAWIGNSEARTTVACGREHAAAMATTWVVADEGVGMCISGGRDAWPLRRPKAMLALTHLADH